LSVVVSAIVNCGETPRHRNDWIYCDNKDRTTWSPWTPYAWLW